MAQVSCVLVLSVMASTAAPLCLALQLQGDLRVRVSCCGRERCQHVFLAASQGRQSAFLDRACLHQYCGDLCVVSLAAIEQCTARI